MFANIFSQSVGCLFVLFMVSFAVQKLLNLIRSHFLVCFISITLGDGSEKILLQFMSRSVRSTFSCQSFIVFGLIFRSSIHFLKTFPVFFFFLIYLYLCCAQALFSCSE